MTATLPNLQAIRSSIRDIPDFPKKGILFKDITPVLKDKALFKQVVDAIARALGGRKIDYVVGIESRGFIFSPAVAYQLNAGFVPIRKLGKLPYTTEKVTYSLEYGDGTLEIHRDAIEPGSTVAVVDDLLATGGTALAASQLAEKLGGKVAACAFLIELSFLNGRDKLSKYDLFSLIQY